jgi:raffinose/stachyose/melibiose transport system permease protein
VSQTVTSRSETPDVRDAVPGRPARKARGRAPGEPRNVAWLYILPGLGFYLLFTLAPLAHTVYLSFFNWDGITVGTYNGLANYRNILGDPNVRDAFKHSLELVLFYSLSAVAIGLFLTALMTRFRVRGMTFFRTVLFLPQTVAVVVVAQAFVWIYAPSGPLNTILADIGLGSLTRDWLGDFTWALPSLGVAGTWITFGLCMVLFLAGAQKIPITLYEAARVDGCGAVREFFSVTLPGLRNEIAVALTLTTITALRSFDLIYNTTQGGPGGTTRVPSVLIYLNAFQYGQVGVAAAVAVLLTIVIFMVAFVITRIGDMGPG